MIPCSKRDSNLKLTKWTHFPKLICIFCFLQRFSSSYSLHSFVPYCLAFRCKEPFVNWSLYYTIRGGIENIENSFALQWMFLRQNHFVHTLTCGVLGMITKIRLSLSVTPGRLNANRWLFPTATIARVQPAIQTGNTRNLPFFRIVSFQEKWSYLCCYHERQLNNCLCPYKEWRTLSILFLYKHLCCVLFAVCVGNNTQFSKPDGNMVSRQHHH